jgi:hypothetical protein
LKDDDKKIQKIKNKYFELQELYKFIVLKELINQDYIGKQFITANSLNNLSYLKQFDFDKNPNIERGDFIKLLNTIFTQINNYINMRGSPIININNLNVLNSSNSLDNKYQLRNEFRININKYVSYQLYTNTIHLSGIFELALSTSGDHTGGIFDHKLNIILNILEQGNLMKSFIDRLEEYALKAL